MSTIASDVSAVIASVIQLADDCRKAETKLALVDLAYAIADACKGGVAPMDALFVAAQDISADQAA